MNRVANFALRFAIRAAVHRRELNCVVLLRLVIRVSGRSRAHGRKLHLERLLVVRGRSRIEADLAALPPVAKNPSRKGLWKPLILRGFAGVIWLWP